MKSKTVAVLLAITLLAPNVSLAQERGFVSSFFCTVFSVFTGNDCSGDVIDDSAVEVVTEVPAGVGQSETQTPSTQGYPSVGGSSSSGVSVPSLTRSDVQSMIDQAFAGLPSPSVAVSSPEVRTVETVVYRSSSAQGDSIVQSSARALASLRADIEAGRVSVPAGSIVGDFVSSAVDVLTAVTGTFTSLFADNLTATNATSTNLVSLTAPVAPSFVATSTTATSTFAGNVSVGGTLELSQGLSVASGGTGGTDVLSARTNLGLAYATPSDILSVLFNNIASWGDSLTAGAGGTPYPTQLASLTGATVYNGGVGGETSTQIKTRMLAATDKHNYPTVIWAGRNNYGAPETIKSDIASMVEALGHENYIILGVINGDYGSEYDGGAGHTLITNLNTDLSQIYGDNFLDVRAHLVSLYDPLDAQDVIDHDRDIVPSSLRADNIHLTTAGYLAVAQFIYDNIGLLRSGSSQSVVTPSNLQYAFSNPFPIGSTTRAAGYFTQIGVGTSTPTQALSVVGGSVEIDQGRFYYAKDSSGNSVRVAGTTGSNLFLGGSYVSNLYLGTGFTGQSQALTIANGGSVGVGTTTPSAKLSVTGAPGTGDIFAVASSTNTRLLTVTSVGALGIGSSSPSALLTVAGTATVTGLTTLSSNVFLNGGSLYLQSSGAGMYLPGNGGLSGNNGAINLIAAGTNQNITLTPSGTGNTLLNGNVGIGTTTPFDKLTVSGNVLMTNGSVLYGYDVGGNRTAIARIAGGTNDLYLGGSFVGNMFLGTGAGTQRLTVLNGGNVGIGTTSPTAQLTNTGTVRFGALGSAGASLVTDAAGNVTVSSDERLKDVVSPFSRGLADVLGLEPITYRWNSLSGLETEGLYTGFSAQDVRDSVPEAVGTDSRGFLTLSDRPILAAVVNAIKELSAKVDALVSSNFVYVNTVRTNELCIEDICINRQQLLEIIGRSGASYTVSAQPVVPQEPVPTPVPGNSSTGSTTEEVIETETASTTPSVTPEETVTGDTAPVVSEVIEVEDGIVVPEEDEPVLSDEGEVGE